MADHENSNSDLHAQLDKMEHECVVLSLTDHMKWKKFVN